MNKFTTLRYSCFLAGGYDGRSILLLNTENQPRLQELGLSAAATLVLEILLEVSLRV